MELFFPERVFFEPISLNYPLGQKLFHFFETKNVEIIKAPIQKVLHSFRVKQKIKNIRMPRRHW